MYTANSMNCMCEVLGIALPGNGTIPCVYAERIRLAKYSGMQIMEMVNKDIKIRDILNEKSFKNALTYKEIFPGARSWTSHRLY